MRRRRRGEKLNNTNKVLLTFLWLRKYPCMSADQQYLILLTALSRLYGAFSQMRLRGRQSLSGIQCRVNGFFFPDAVGCIDGTPHETYRPQVGPQAQFYSGHRHYHVMNIQLIVDNQGNIVFLQTGLSIFRLNELCRKFYSNGENWTWNCLRNAKRDSSPCGQGLWGFCPSLNSIPGCTNQTNANASAATGP